MRFPSYGAAGVLTVCLLSAPALAESVGKIGFSGKAGVTCITSGCHSGGPTPTVEISGPTSLAAGATGQYTLIIRGGAGVRGGMNVAVDNTAASLQISSGLRKEKNELTHVAPKPFGSNGEVRFDFSMVAPSSGGTVKIFGAGNSVNGNAVEGGDGAAATSVTVTITGGEEAGGCSSTGGAPVLVFALAAGMTLLRRRRS